MLLQKCYLLHSQGKLDEFLECGKQLLFQEWKEVEADESKSSEEEMRCVFDYN